MVEHKPCSDVLYYLREGYVLIAVCLCVGLFVCEHDYTKTTRQITTELGGTLRHGFGNNSLHFGADLDQGVSPGLSLNFI